MAAPAGPSQDDVVLLSMTTRGGVVVPASPKYDLLVREQHNALHHSRKPAFFVECCDTADVVGAVQFAAKHKMNVSVRSGGHGADGSSLEDGSMVIDLNIDHVEFAAETAKLGPAATLHSINIASLRAGRMIPVGIAPPTGCGGLILHGGVGFLMHRFGAAVDSVQGLTIVLADGSIKTVDRNSTGEDRELFFAARGAAGVIGIVTEIVMQTYPMEMVTGGLWVMPDDAAYSGGRALQKLARDITIKQEKAGNRTLFGAVLTGNAPPLPSLPAEAHGAPINIVWLGAWGDNDAAQELLKAFQDRPILMGKPPSIVPFNIFNQMLNPLLMSFPAFGAYYKGEFPDYDKLQDAHLDAVAAVWAAKEMPTLGAGFCGIELHGGTAGKQHGDHLNAGNDHSVSSIRGLGMSIPILCYFPVDAEGKNFDKARKLARDVAAAVQSAAPTTTYTNYFSAPGDDDKVDLGGKLERAFADADRARIKAVKARVDPDNMFRRKTLLL